MTPNRILSTLEAYERWSSTYHAVPHNPLMRAEQRAMLAEWPLVRGRRVLDLACGSGRYASLLTRDAAAQVVALDFSAGMLQRVAQGSRVRADMMHLPFAPDTFDVVISGLALAHAADVYRWMTEVARVLKKGGMLLYSDFHPEAARAGMTRTFKDASGQSYAVPHQHYDVSMQKVAAAAAGLAVETVRELRVGMEFQESYSGSEALYRNWHGVPLVLIVRARK